MSIRLASVVATYPSRRTVDLVYLDNGLPVANVQIMSGMVASDCGSWNVPETAAPASQGVAGGLSTTGRQLIAVVVAVGPRAFVIGFLAPSGGQMQFDEQGREVYRSASGTYATFGPDGTVELYHPGGAYFAIGAPGHTDLAPLASNGNWELPELEPPTITLVTTGFEMQVAPVGAVSIKAQGGVTITAPSTEFDGAVSTTGNLVVGTGASGTFTAASGQIVTVQDGIITNIL